MTTKLQLLLIISFSSSLIYCSSEKSFTIGIDVYFDDSFANETESLRLAYVWVNSLLRQINLHIQITSIRRLPPEFHTGEDQFGKTILDDRNSNHSNHFWTEYSADSPATDPWVTPGSYCKYPDASFLYREEIEDGSVRDWNLLSRHLLDAMLKTMKMAESQGKLSNCSCPQAAACLPHSVYVAANPSFATCASAWVVKEFSGHKCIHRVPLANESAIPICGNGIVEQNEECDCRSDDLDCSRCCNMNSCTRNHPCQTMSTTVRTTIPSTTATTITKPTTPSTPSTPATLTTVEDKTSTRKREESTKTWIIITIAAVFMMFVILMAILIICLMIKSYRKKRTKGRIRSSNHKGTSSRSSFTRNPSATSLSASLPSSRSAKSPKRSKSQPNKDKTTTYVMGPTTEFFR